MAANSSANENFSQIPLENASTEGNEGAGNIDVEGRTVKKKRVPRRILHFSDGVLEEYSTDEEEEVEEPKPEVNPKTLQWLPWFWYYTVFGATRALAAADTCGEKLAWFFGITSPKYQYAIDEYNRMKKEEEEEKEREQREYEAMVYRQGQLVEHAEGGTSNLAYSEPDLNAVSGNESLQKY